MIPILLKRLSFIFLLFAPSLTLHAQDGRIDAMTERALEALHNLDVASAQVQVDSILALEPGNPAGELLLAAAQYLHFLENPKDEGGVKRLEKTIERAIHLAERRLARNREDAVAMHHLGNAYLYLAGLHSHRDNYMRAFWYVRNGLKTLNQAVRTDSTLFDAYLGLGAFHYFSDIMPKFVKTVSSIMGLEADREQGLRELQIVAERGKFLKTAAQLALGDIYIHHEESYEKALEIFSKLSEAYPNNLFYRHYHANALRRTGNYAGSLEAYNAILKTPNAGAFPNLARTAWYWIGELHFEMNAFDKAITAYSQAIDVLGATSEDRIWAFAWSHYKRGLCYELSGDMPEARANYKAIRKSDSKRAHEAARKQLKEPLLPIDAAFIRGRNAFRAKRYESAMQIFVEIEARLAERNDDWPLIRRAEVKYNIGKVQKKLGALDSAVVAFQHVLDARKVDGDWLKPWARYHLGECFRRQGKAALAEEAYEKAARFKDSDLRFEVKKARSLLAQAQPAESTH